MSFTHKNTIWDICGVGLLLGTKREVVEADILISWESRERGRLGPRQGEHVVSIWAQRGILHGLIMGSLAVNRDHSLSTEENGSIQWLLIGMRKTELSTSPHPFKHQIITTIAKGEGADGFLDRLVRKPNVCPLSSTFRGYCSLYSSNSKALIPTPYTVKKKKSQECLGNRSSPYHLLFLKVLARCLGLCKSCHGSVPFHPFISFRLHKN